MFHVKHRLFVRTELTVDGAGTAIHVAELEPVENGFCRMLRIIELDPNSAITGAAREGRTAGMANEPNALVPHPDTYDQFPDITARHLNEEEFEGLWTEATTLFPEL
ncbi:hypothetical protein [Corynebacterium halotolerans]|uniref:hypothetical protein n=1 Tax=Corynebacterium halotolerans TaxID=225326 RepID=UPI003CF95311